MGTNDSVRQIQTHDHSNQTSIQDIHTHVVKPKDTYQTMKMRLGDKLWISVPDNYRETGQRQNFNNHELVQDEYLKV